MPEICRFRGIVVFVNYNDHPPPHVHVRHGGRKGRIRIEPLVVMDGDLSVGTRRRVLRWAAAHVPDLLADWHLAQAGRPPFPIPPPTE
jgi:hypothetical protein